VCECVCTYVRCIQSIHTYTYKYTCTKYTLCYPPPPPLTRQPRTRGAPKKKSAQTRTFSFSPGTGHELRDLQIKKNTSAHVLKESRDDSALTCILLLPLTQLPQTRGSSKTPRRTCSRKRVCMLLQWSRMSRASTSRFTKVFFLFFFYILFCVQCFSVIYSRRSGVPVFYYVVMCAFVFHVICVIGFSCMF
jgi:hypothetical protein